MFLENFPWICSWQLFFFHRYCICFLRGGSLPPAKCWLNTSPMDKNSPEIMSDEVLTWIVKREQNGVPFIFAAKKSNKYLQHLPFLTSELFKLQLKTPLCCSRSSKSRHHDFHHHHHHHHHHHTMDRIIAAASDSGTSEHMLNPKRGHSVLDPQKNRVFLSGCKFLVVLQGLPGHHLKRCPKNRRNPNHHQGTNATCQSLGLIFPCNKVLMVDPVLPHNLFGNSG